MKEQFDIKHVKGWSYVIYNVADQIAVIIASTANYILRIGEIPEAQRESLYAFASPIISEANNIATDLKTMVFNLEKLKGNELLQYLPPFQRIQNLADECRRFVTLLKALQERYKHNEVLFRALSNVIVPLEEKIDTLVESTKALYIVLEEVAPQLGLSPENLEELKYFPPEPTEAVEAPETEEDEEEDEIIRLLDEVFLIITTSGVQFKGDFNQFWRTEIVEPIVEALTTKGVEFRRKIAEPLRSLAALSTGVDRWDLDEKTKEQIKSKLRELRSKLFALAGLSSVVEKHKSR